MKKVENSVTIQNKKYPYTLTQRKGGEVYVECPAAKIAQVFLAEDVATLLIDLPELIIAEKKYEAGQSKVIRFRVAPAEKQAIEKKAVANGYESVSEYLRQLALSA